MAAIVSFIADIKLTPDDQVKILELGAAFQSGFSGFKRLFEKEALAEHVYPFYEGFGIPVYLESDHLPDHTNPTIAREGVLKGRMHPVNLPPEFNPSRIEDHAAIMMRSGYASEPDRVKRQKEQKVRQVL